MLIHSNELQNLTNHFELIVIGRNLSSFWQLELWDTMVIILSQVPQIGENYVSPKELHPCCVLRDLCWVISYLVGWGWL